MLRGQGRFLVRSLYYLYCISYGLMCFVFLRIYWCYVLIENGKKGGFLKMKRVCLMAQPEMPTCLCPFHLLVVGTIFVSYFMVDFIIKELG